MTIIISNSFLIDTTAPRLLSCPEHIVEVAPAMSEEVSVSWQIPVFEDNSGLPPRVRERTGQSSGDVFQEGVHLIEYIASDRDGNQNTDCRFKVTVRGNLILLLCTVTVLTQFCC